MKGKKRVALTLFLAQSNRECFITFATKKKVSEERKFTSDYYKEMIVKIVSSAFKNKGVEQVQLPKH